MDIWYHFNHLSLWVSIVDDRKSDPIDYLNKTIIQVSVSRATYYRRLIKNAFHRVFYTETEGCIESIIGQTPKGILKVF